jgi:hypothetical protein
MHSARHCYLDLISKISARNHNGSVPTGFELAWNSGRMQPYVQLRTWTYSKHLFPLIYYDCWRLMIRLSERQTEETQGNRDLGLS